MEKKIFLRDLKPGMFVVRAGAGTFDNPVVEYGRRVTDVAFIKELERLGSFWVFIDTERGGDVAEAAVDGVSSKVRANMDLYEETMSYARHFMDQVGRSGRIEAQEAGVFVERIIESVHEDATGLFAISKLKARDEYTYSHCVNVCLLVVMVGRHVGLKDNALKVLGLCGLYHDVGKSKIPGEILNKPGKLDEVEFEVIKRHTLHGYNLIKNSNNTPGYVAMTALEHHERNDGRGYPRGLKAHKISWPAKLVGLCDVYDAMTSERVYKAGRTPKEVLAMLYALKGKEFDDTNVENFIKCVGIYPEGTLVRLTGGGMAVIIKNNPQNLLKPQIKIIGNGSLLKTPLSVDLAESDDPAHEIVSNLDPTALGINPLAYL